MTKSEFFKAEEGWFPVIRLNELSPFVDGQREFLEAISDFRIAEATNQIPPDGFQMPNIYRTFEDIDPKSPDAFKIRQVPVLYIGKIIGLEFVPDWAGLVSKGETDGLIVARTA